MIISNAKNPNPWQKILSEKLPGIDVLVYPHVGNPDLIDFIVCWKPEIGTLEKFKNVKVIQSLGAAIDHITSHYSVPQGCHLTRIVDYNLTQDLWEFVLAGVMNQMKNLNIYSQNKSTKSWKPIDYQRITETKISILGLGEIGGFVAEQFAKLGFKVNGWASSTKDIPGVESFVGPTELEACLKNADYLISILPNTKATKGILNKHNLNNLNNGGYLINVGRGEHLVERDLIQLIKENHLAGALLDVFQHEPLPQDHKFWSMEEITITPHIASKTNLDSASDLIAENYKRYKLGDPLLHSVKADREY